MTNFEKVEQLREKANVSFEDARDALEKSNWDLLDAMVQLERDGKVVSDGHSAYSTQKQEAPAAEDKDSRFMQTLARVGRALVRLLERGNANSFEISRKGERIFGLPVTVLVVLLIFMLPFTVIALLVGLFTGFHYAFRGPDLGREGINNAMDKVSGMAENIKQDIQREKNRESDNH